MSAPPPTADGTDQRLHSLERDLDTMRSAARIVLLSILMLAYLYCVYLLLRTPSMAKMADEMLGGEPLAATTELVFSYYILFIVADTLLAALGIVLIFWPPRLRGGWGTAAIIGVLMLQGAFVRMALFTPLFWMLDSLGG